MNAIRIVNAIKELTDDHATTLMIFNANRAGGPRNTIGVSAEWTKHKTGWFYGDSLVDALESAVESKRQGG